MKYLKVIVIVCIISLWIFFSARSDYQWADLIIEKEIPNGWSLIYKQDNLSDLTLPWTWIKAPVTGIWFINDSHTKKLNQKMYIIHTFRVSYDYSKTDKKDSWELVNVKTKESAILDTNQNLSAIDSSKLKWYKYEVGTPGYQIIQYMVNYDENS